MGSGATKFRFVGRSTKKQQPMSRSNSFPVVKVNEQESKVNVQRVMTDGHLDVKPMLENGDAVKKPPTQKSEGGEITLNGHGGEESTTFQASLTENCHLSIPENDNKSATTPPLSARKLSQIKISKFSEKITASELYNLLIAETWQGLPQIHDMGFMLLLDCRDKPSFENLHVITARHHSALYSEYGLLLPSQLKLFHLVVLYGQSSTCDGVYDYSKKLAEDEVEHFVLDVGVAEFFTKYPFLSTKNHFLTNDIRSTLQTMPSEILPGRLYQGNGKHALDPYIISSLGITHIVNVTLEHPNKFEDIVRYLRIQLDDRPHVDLHSWLPKTSAFVQDAIGEKTVETMKPHGAVLVHCNLGRSRSSTVVLGYLMQAHNMSLGEASRLLKDCRPSVRPNIGFLEQLLRYEQEIFGFSKTELNELPF